MERCLPTSGVDCPTTPAKLIAAFAGHKAAVEVIGFSPDRHLLASVDRSNAVRIWDLSRSQPGERAAFWASTEGCRSLAFSPNSRTLVLGSGAGALTLYDVSEKSAPELRVLRGGRGATVALAFSPDGKMLAGAGDDQTLRVWEPAGGVGAEAKIQLPGHTRPIRALGFAPDGGSVATGAQDATARVWTLSRIRSSQRMALLHGSEVTAVGYSADGKTLATVEKSRGVRIWDLAALPPVARVELGSRTANTRLVLLTPNGDTVVTVDGSQVLNWNARTGKPKQVWSLPSAQASSVAVTPDGRYFARGLSDGIVEVYRVAEKRS